MAYTFDEARSATLDYFHGDELARDAFIEKYALRNENNELLEKTPADMHARLATEFARIEAKYPNPLSYEEIFELFSTWTVIPQGSPMSAIGDSYRLQSYSNCFVVKLNDSYGSILRADQELAQIMKRRGGCGIDLSNLRPKGAPTRNAARTTAGIEGFAERFNNTTREVGQGGRRGALMQMLSCHHPQIIDFITSKLDETKLTGCNISVKYTDEFMRALENDETYEQRFPVVGGDKIVSRQVKARDVWDKTVYAAWKRAEPGVLFWDRMTSYTPTDCYADVGFKTIATNPCSELPLADADSCRLMLINLSKFVKNKFTPSAEFDYDAFGDVAVKAQRLMDDLVDLEIEAVQKIIKKVKIDPEDTDDKQVELNLWERVLDKAVRGRRTGLGITALGDALAFLNLKYGSDESITVTSNIYKSLALLAYRSSVWMAKERGAFPVYDETKEVGNEYLEHLFSANPALRHEHFLYGRRNIALLTTSPAGTVSCVAQTTNGIEPVVFLAQKRRRKVNKEDSSQKIDFIDKVGDCWQEYVVNHMGLQEWIEITGNTDTTQSPYHGATCEEIDPLKAVEIQAVAQEWVDNSISKTVNLPREASQEVVDSIYRLAWKKGLKGITVYRKGCRDAVIRDAKDDVAQLAVAKFKRPKELKCDIHRANVKGEAYTVLVGLIDDKPYEVFAGLSQHVSMPKKTKHGSIIKNGKNKDGVTTYNLRIPIDADDSIMLKDIVELFDNALYGAFTRTISLSLRHGVPVTEIIDQVRKDKHSDVTSFASVLARVLKQYVSDGSKAAGKCEACGGELVYSGGCVSCVGCASSKCG